MSDGTNASGPAHMAPQPALGLAFDASGVLRPVGLDPLTRGDGVNEQTTLWAVHVQGPDDLHACPDRETADALALLLNRQFQRHARPNDPPMVATVTEWPYGYEAWKADSEQLRFEAVKA